MFKGKKFAVIAQVVEHRLGKTKVISANLINGSSFLSCLVRHPSSVGRARLS